MDPITTAVVAALSKLAEPAVRDGYDALKTLVRQKLGAESEVAVAIERLEAKPESAARQTGLEEEVAAAQADQDEELSSAAHDLLQRVQPQSAAPPGVQQTVKGDRNVFSGTGKVSVHRM